MADASGIDKVRVQCHSCGAKFKAPASKAGKKGPCPKCKTILLVPQPQSSAAAADVDWSMLSDAVAEAPAKGRDDGYDLADSDAPSPSSRIAAAPAARAAFSPAVPAGLTPVLAASAAAPARSGMARVLNYRGRGGAAVKTIAAEPGAGRFILGIVLALAFGAVAGTVWMVVWLFLCGSGILAIGLGAAVGGGMYLGYGKQSVAAGAVASVIALLMIFTGIAIPSALIALAGWGVQAAGQQITIRPYSPTVARADLPRMLADDMFDERGVTALTATELERLQIKAAAEEQVANFSNKELELAYKRQQVRHTREMDLFNAMLLDMEAAEDKDLQDEYDQIRAETSRMSLADCDMFLANWKPSAGPGFWNVFGQMFSLWEVLWMILALGAAFKISGL